MIGEAANEAAEVVVGVGTGEGVGRWLDTGRCRPEVPFFGKMA